MELAAHHAMLHSSETLQEAFAHASTDTMNFTMPINPVPAENVLLNVKHVQLHPPHAHHAISQEIDSLELMLQDVKLAFANLDSTPLLMVHVFNLTAMLILSVLNANKDLNYVFNAWPQKTELLNFQKAFVFVWMDSMLMLVTTVLHAHVDVYSALQQLTVQAVLSWPLLMQLELELAHALQRPTSLSHQKELVTVLLVDPIAMSVLMPIPAQLVFHLSLRQSITNVSAQQRTSSITPVNASHAQLDVNHALQQLIAADVLNHLCFKEQFVKPTAMMDLPLLDQSAEDAQLDAYNALKTSSASTAPMVSTCTTVPATAYALQELLEIAHQATGTVSHATLHV
jgi:hypothetical protein